jgi:uracil-DNA glycosylase
MPKRRPWLEGEVEVVRPKVIACLGATAAQALLGRDFRRKQTERFIEDLKVAAAAVRRER